MDNKSNIIQKGKNSRSYVIILIKSYSGISKKKEEYEKTQRERNPKNVQLGGCFETPDKNSTAKKRRTSSRSDFELSSSKKNLFPGFEPEEKQKNLLEKVNGYIEKETEILTRINKENHIKCQQIMEFSEQLQKENKSLKLNISVQNQKIKELERYKEKYFEIQNEGRPNAQSHDQMKEYLKEIDHKIRIQIQVAEETLKKRIQTLEQKLVQINSSILKQTNHFSQIHDEKISQLKKSLKEDKHPFPNHQNEKETELTHKLEIIKRLFRKLNDHVTIKGKEAQKIFNSLLETLEIKEVQQELNQQEKQDIEDIQMFFQEILKNAKLHFKEELKSINLKGKFTAEKLEYFLSLVLRNFLNTFQVHFSYKDLFWEN